MSVSNKQNLKDLSILMRKNGATYSEISQKLKVSRGLLSKWFKDLALSPAEKEQILKHQKDVILRSRNKSKLSREMKKVFNERQVLIDAQKSFKKFLGKPRFLIGLSMYLSHGSFSNSYLQFSSGDEDNCKIFTDWANAFLGTLPHHFRYRIYMGNDLNYQENRVFWSRKLVINEKQFMEPVIYKKNSKTTENALNKGFLQIIVPGIKSIRTLNVWKKLILSYYQQVK